jgi:branched-chain amino acid transport system permease protein
VGRLSDHRRHRGFAGTTVNVPLAVLPFALLYAIIGTSALGLVIARSVIAPLSLQRPLAMLIATIGLAIVLEEIMRMANHSRELVLAPILAGTLVEWPSAIFVIRISIIQALVFGVSLGLAIMLALFVGYHRFGRLWRACAQDIRMVALLGIDPRPIITATIVIGSALAATSGIMLAIYYGSVSFYMGAMLGLKALYVAVIGGLGSLGGAIAGAFVLGFFEAMWSAYLSGAYRDVASFAALTFLLVLRPAGLLAPSVEAYERV